MHAKRRQQHRATRPVTPKRPPITLAPVSPVKIKAEGTSAEVITQERMKKFHELEAEYYDIRDRYLAEYSRIKKQVEEGATVRLGDWKLKPKTALVRHPRYKQALIDAKGEDYQLRVLAGTAPHVHFKVTVE